MLGVPSVSLPLLLRSSFFISICTMISVCVCLLCQPAVSWWKGSADSAVSCLPSWHLQLQASASSPSTSSLPPTVLIFRNFPLFSSIGLLSALDPPPLLHCLRTCLRSTASCWYQNSKHHIVWHYPVCHMLPQKPLSLKPPKLSQLYYSNNNNNYNLF